MYHADWMINIVELHHYTNVDADDVLSHLS